MMEEFHGYNLRLPKIPQDISLGTIFYKQIYCIA